MRSEHTDSNYDDKFNTVPNKLSEDNYFPKEVKFQRHVCDAISEYPSEVVLKVTDYTHPSMDKHSRKNVTFNKYGIQHSKTTPNHSYSNSKQMYNGYQQITHSSAGSNLESKDFGHYNSCITKTHEKARNGSSNFELEWYTRPIHKNYTNSSNPGFSKYSISPVTRFEEKQEMKLRQNIIDVPYTKEDHITSASSIDTLAKRYFPVTLGAALEVMKPFTPDIEDTNPSKDNIKATILSSSSKSQKMARPSSGHSSTSSRSRSRRSRPSSAQSSSSSTSKSSLDKLHLMAVEAPTTGSSPVLLSSPYQSELARLRMERLRIEEDHLLEIKRQEELERIRGPKPKWYELKDSKFHYEAHKNNNLLKTRDSWQSLLDYRTELEEASKQFHTSYNNDVL